MATTSLSSTIHLVVPGPRPGNRHFRARQSERDGVIRCDGDLDAWAASHLVDAVDRCAPAFSTLVFDLDEVHFVDVRGLNSIVRNLSFGHAVVLVSPPPMLRRMLAVAGLDELPRLRIVSLEDDPPAPTT